MQEIFHDVLTSLPTTYISQRILRMLSLSLSLLPGERRTWGGEQQYKRAAVHEIAGCIKSRAALPAIPPLERARVHRVMHCSARFVAARPCEEYRFQSACMRNTIRCGFPSVRRTGTVATRSYTQTHTDVHSNALCSLREKTA